MQGYKISALSAKTQELIKLKQIDINKDGLINIDNEELANLLSATGKNDINDLKFDSWFEKNEGGLKAVSVIGTAAGFMLWNAYMAVASKCKNGSILGGVLSLATLAIIFGLKPQLVKWIDEKNEKLPLVESKDNEIVKKQIQTEPPSKIKTQFEEGFKELGISEGIELKEYIPQRGEYWVSILKAKYDTDDVTAQKMANKIKEMIYKDPTAAKQSPVMYLPEEWEFEGKVYKYNESAKPQVTSEYSNKVKTEMGDMSPDLKY